MYTPREVAVQDTVLYMLKHIATWIAFMAIISGIILGIGLLIFRFHWIGYIVAAIFTIAFTADGIYSARRFWRDCKYQVWLDKHAGDE